MTTNITEEYKELKDTISIGIDGLLNIALPNETTQKQALRVLLNKSIDACLESQLKWLLNKFPKTINRRYMEKHLRYRRKAIEDCRSILTQCLDSNKE